MLPESEDDVISEVDSAAALDETGQGIDESWSELGVNVRQYNPAREFANRVLYNRWYTAMYIAVFLAQVVLFIWGIAHHQLFSNLNNVDAWYIVVDVIITLLMVSEVAMRILAARDGAFWKSWINLFDFSICLLCICALFLYFVDPETVVFGSLVLALRYGSQLIRMGMMVKNHKERKKRRAAAETFVDFSAVAVHHDSTELTGLGERNLADYAPGMRLGAEEEEEDTLSTLSDFDIDEPLTLISEGLGSQDGDYATVDT